MNKKGYTLIELLAVIAILGILMGLAYVGVSSYLRSTTKAVIDDYEKNLKTAATNYLIKNSDMVPDVNQEVVLDAQELKDKGFLEEMMDPRNKNSSCVSGSYVKVVNKGVVSYNRDLEYKVCLKCQSYKSDVCD